MTDGTGTAELRPLQIEANGINDMRLAAVSIATSPVPPWPLWQAVTMAVSIGYMPIRRPTK